MKKHLGVLAGLLPLVASAQLVMTNNYYVVLTGGSQANPTSLVLTNSAPTGITNTGTGWIISENEFNQVDWNIGTNTGTYFVPFGYATTDYLPLSCNITAAGTGTGSIKFATYHGSSWDNSLYEPSDVNNMTDFGAPNYSNNAVDRFWIIDANGYSLKPTPTIKLTYIRNGGASEIAAPNYMNEPTFIVQRYNSTLNQWYDFFGVSGTDVTTSNTGTVSSGSVPPADFYRSWCVFNDSSQITNVPIVMNQNSITVYPNPGTGRFTVQGLEEGQVIELYNYLGQLLTTSVADNSTFMHFDISNDANGIYLLRIINKNGSGIIEKKIVKEQ